MKISKIYIKDFHQFKDFTLDLTYPQGHKKAGQPLDKVCFIGQSGTGKTSLLELIPMFLYGYKTNLILKVGERRIAEKIEIDIYFGFSNEHQTIIDFTIEKTYTPEKDFIGIRTSLRSFDDLDKMSISYFKNEWKRFY